MPDPTTKTLIIVRTCITSRGRFDVEIPGGTRDIEPLEFPIAEALDLLSLGVAREVAPPPPPIPSSVPAPSDQTPAPPVE